MKKNYKYNQKNFIMLVDGSYYLYLAYNVFPFLVNRVGEPTGAIYGMLNILRSLFVKYQPTHAAIIFDRKEKNFRNKLFKHYKSNRQPMPNNLCVQIKPLFSILKAMGLSVINISGVEADDVIGTLARKAEKMGYLVLISTGDKDMAQLVTHKTALINTVNKTFFGPEEILAKYGVPPKLIVDFLALTGDRSDNIPGVPGIGKKTAQFLLHKYGGLDMLYKQIDEIAGMKFRSVRTIVNNLKQNKEMAYLSYQLATIKTDVELDVIYEQLTIHELIKDELLNLFKKYEFNHWIADIKTGKWS